MNKIHRTVWSETRQAYVVAHEGAAARGKTGSSRLCVAQAVATALLGLASSQAAAVDLCTTATTTINSAVGGADICILNGESVNISGTGSINTAGTAIRLAGPVGNIINSGTVNSVGTAIVSSVPATISDGITNSGLINGGTHGIYISGTLVGNVSNSGTISSGHHAIHLTGQVVTGSVINAAGGLISSPGIGTEGAALSLSTSNIAGAIVNIGTIAAGTYGIYVSNRSTVTGGITSSGTISAGGGTSSPITKFAIYAGATASVGGIAITGNNTAKLIGPVEAINTPVTVVSGATYTMDNGQLFTLTNSSFTNAGTLKIGTGSTGTITGNFAQVSTGVFQVGSTGLASGQYGVLTVSGTVTLPASAQFGVSAGNAATCDGITAGTTLTGVITSTGAMSAGGGFTVTDNCTGIDFTAQATANRIDLVAITAAPVTAQSIPTLSEWGLIALTGLLGLFGWRQMRRRDPHNRLF